MNHHWTVGARWDLIAGLALAGALAGPASGGEAFNVRDYGAAGERCLPMLPQ